jgi:hypothetical protein
MVGRFFDAEDRSSSRSWFAGRAKPISTFRLVKPALRLPIQIHDDLRAQKYFPARLLIEA